MPCAKMIECVPDRGIRAVRQFSGKTAGGALTGRHQRSILTPERPRCANRPGMPIPPPPSLHPAPAPTTTPPVKQAACLSDCHLWPYGQSTQLGGGCRRYYQSFVKCAYITERRLRQHAEKPFSNVTRAVCAPYLRLDARYNNAMPTAIAPAIMNPATVP